MQRWLIDLRVGIDWPETEGHPTVENFLTKLYNQCFRQFNASKDLDTADLGLPFFDAEAPIRDLAIESAFATETLGRAMDEATLARRKVNEIELLRGRVGDWPDGTALAKDRT